MPNRLFGASELTIFRNGDRPGADPKTAAASDFHSSTVLGPEPPWKLFNREILFAHPRRADGKPLNHQRPVECILLHRQKFDRASAFAQCLLLSAQKQRRSPRGRTAEVRSLVALDNFLLLCPRDSNASARLRLILFQPRDPAFYERVTEMHRVVINGVFSPAAINAAFAAVGSRSASAQATQLSAISWIARGIIVPK